MGNGLGELRELLHAERIRAHRAITSFAQADVDERFVGALHRLIGREAGNLRHVTNEAHSGHF